MTAALIASVCVIALLCATLVALALIFSRAISRALSLTDRVHERQSKSQSSLLDRFMALDFALFKGYESTELAEEGGFFAPEEQGEEKAGEISLEIPRPGGWGSIRLGEQRARAVAEEELILREDFEEQS